MKYEVTLGDKTRNVEIEPVDGKVRVTVDGVVHLVDLLRPTPDAFQILVDDASWEAGVVAIGGDDYLVDVMGHARTVTVVDPRRKALRLSAAAAGGTLVSQMPGRVVKHLAAVGDTVKKGQPVIVVEAMKMENEIKSPADGRVVEIYVAEGSAVETGAKLLRVEA